MLFTDVNICYFGALVLPLLSFSNPLYDTTLTRRSSKLLTLKSVRANGELIISIQTGSRGCFIGSSEEKADTTGGLFILKSLTGGREDSKWLLEIENQYWSY